MSIMHDLRIKADADVTVEVCDSHGDIVLELDAPSFWGQASLSEEAAAELHEWLAEYFNRVRRADADAE